jgi:hypothetical protein
MVPKALQIVMGLMEGLAWKYVNHVVRVRGGGQVYMIKLFLKGGICHSL